MNTRGLAFATIMIGVVALLVACNSKATQDAVDTETPPTEVLDAEGGTDADMPTPPDPTLIPPYIATIDPMQRIAGSYQFRPIGEETADYFLTLNPDGTAEIDERPIGSTNPGDLSVDAFGHWTIDEETILFQATEIRGQPAAENDMVRISFQAGFPVITDIKIGDHFEHLEKSAFSLGAGEKGPLVRQLNQLLASIDYLGFTDPGDDVYAEQTRQAVVAFQVSQGLCPNGVLDAKTWLSLNNPRPPLPTPTSLATTAPPVTATTIDIDNLRSGPGTEYEVLATIPHGTTLEITGRDAEGKWVQTTYPDSGARAWVSAEFVTISGDLASVPVVDAAAFQGEAPEGLATALAPTRAPTTGAPSLTTLPTHTEDGRPIVYFTFDDGPQPSSTEAISDLFDQYDGDATFFMVGRNVMAYPELVREATVSGNYIADHTWDHGDLGGMTKEQFVDEVERTREAILQVAGDLFNQAGQPMDAGAVRLDEVKIKSVVLEDGQCLKLVNQPN
jgi:hypothetical protein